MTADPPIERNFRILRHDGDIYIHWKDLLSLAARSTDLVFLFSDLTQAIQFYERQERRPDDAGDDRD